MLPRYRRTWVSERRGRSVRRGREAGLALILAGLLAAATGSRADDLPGFSVALARASVTRMESLARRIDDSGAADSVMLKEAESLVVLTGTLVEAAARAGGEAPPRVRAALEDSAIVQALEGLRRRLDCEACETARRLTDALLAEVRVRLGWPERSEAFLASLDSISPGEDGDWRRQVELPARIEAAPRTAWFSIPAFEGDALRLRVAGTGFGELTLVGRLEAPLPNSRRRLEGEVVYVIDPSTEVRLLRIVLDEPEEGLAGGVESLELVAERLRRTFGGRGESPAALPLLLDGRSLVSVEQGEAPRWRLSVYGGEVVDIRTSELPDHCDTQLRLLAESVGSGFEPIAEDDDGGGGLASRVEWASEVEAEFAIEVSTLDSSACVFEIEVRREAIGQGVLLLANRSEAAPVIEPDATRREFRSQGSASYVAIAARAGRLYGIESSSNVSLEAGSTVFRGPTRSALAALGWDWSCGAGAPSPDGGSREVVESAEEGLGLLRLESNGSSGAGWLRTCELAALPPALSLDPTGGSLALERSGGYGVVHVGAGEPLTIELDVVKGDFVEYLIEVADEQLLSQLSAPKGPFGENSQAVNGGVAAWGEGSRRTYTMMAVESGRAVLTRIEGPESSVDLRIDWSVDPPYNGLQVGDCVRIGRHTEIQGSDNWVPDMDTGLGITSRICRRRGTEPIDPGPEIPGYVDGPYLVNLGWDLGSFVWRTRDLQKVECPAAPAEDWPASALVCESEGESADD